MGSGAVTKRERREIVTRKRAIRKGDYVWIHGSDFGRVESIRTEPYAKGQEPTRVAVVRFDVTTRIAARWLELATDEEIINELGDSA